MKETQRAAEALGLPFQYVTVSGIGEFQQAFDAITRDGAEGLITFPDALTLAHRREIALFCARRRIPSISGWAEFADAGGLVTYGPNLVHSLRSIAIYVEKLLKGSIPADLPIEQPKTLELVINLNTVKQIGLTIPPSVLARADKVIR